MDTRILEIKTLENKITNISSGIDFHYISLGNSIVLNEPDESIINKNQLSSDLKNIKELFIIYDEAEKKKERISVLKKEISDLDQKIKDFHKKISEIEKENSKHYIGIAETLYELYKIDNQKMADLEPYFTELIIVDNKNKEINEKIKDIENEKKSSIFGKLKDTGEKTILNTKKRYNYSLMLSHYKTAGEKMCVDKIFENANNSDIEALFVSYKNNLNLEEDISEKIEALIVEKNGLRLENESIMQEFNFDTNSYINDIKIKKDNALKDFGKKIFDIVNESEKDDETVLSLKESGTEINRLFGEIKILKSEKEELVKKMEQVKLAMEIDKTEKEISSHIAAIEKKNQKIAELNKEIEEYNNLVNLSEKELAELRKKVVKQD